jgi:hypothetical protein
MHGSYKPDIHVQNEYMRISICVEPKHRDAAAPGQSGPRLPGEGDEDMTQANHRLVPACLLAGLLLSAPAAQAQLGDLLNQGKSGGSSGLGGLLPGQSASSGSTGNVAGVLQFCIKNNYLGGDAASSVKDKLMGKLGKNAPSTDNSYKDGATGILNGSDGKKVDLRGGGLKKEVTKRVCDQVLGQAKSLL